MQPRRLMLAIILLIPIPANAAEPVVDAGVDVVFTELTGQSESNVFVLDVDDPDAEPIPLTHNIGEARYLEENPDASIEDYYPAYQGIWRLVVPRHRPGEYQLHNLETGKSFPIAACKYCTLVSTSPSGRYIVFHENDYVWLYDVALRDEPVPLLYVLYWRMFWLNEDRFLYWYEGSGQYVVYDVIPQQHYRLTDVLDAVTLAMTVRGAPAGADPEAIGLPARPYPSLPDYIAIFPYDWSPDGTQVVYANEDYTVTDGQVCDGCGVSSYDVITGEIRPLFSRPGEQGGWRVTNLMWSPDGTRFLAGFTEIGVLHQPDEYWLYTLADATARPVFNAVSDVQWLD